MDKKYGQTRIFNVTVHGRIIIDQALNAKIFKLIFFIWNSKIENQKIENSESIDIFRNKFLLSPSHRWYGEGCKVEIKAFLVLRSAFCILHSTCSTVLLHRRRIKVKVMVYYSKCYWEKTKEREGRKTRRREEEKERKWKWKWGRRPKFWTLQMFVSVGSTSSSSFRLESWIYFKFVPSSLVGWLDSLASSLVSTSQV